MKKFVLTICSLYMFLVCHCLGAIKGFDDIKVGLYSGTFDPPTLAHDHIIREAIKYLDLDKLYIFVNKNDSKDYKCSIRQRVEMLKRMLSDIEDKVIIIDQVSDKKHQDYLFLKKCVNRPIFCITGYDSYAKRLMLPIEIRAKFDAIAVIPRSGLENNNLEYESNAFILPVDQNIIQGISSTEVRKKLSTGNVDNIALHPNVLKYITENKLYQNDASKSALYEEAYYAYIGRMFVTIPLPPFDPQASSEAWPENFSKWVSTNRK